MTPTHWHGARSVSGPVDHDGCCVDQPSWTPATASQIAAALRATADTDAADRLAKALATPTHSKDTP